MPKLEKLYTEKDDCFLSINNTVIEKRNEENTRIYYIYICSIYIIYFPISWKIKIFVKKIKILAGKF